ncbi:MAG TPA: MFS transporter, partial [Thermoplasmata archaeon]|nr:MFS transporter [Thermoplasmata archaeon]
PIGITAVMMSQRYIAADRKHAETRLDIPGALTITAGLVLLVYGFTNAAERGFLSLSTAVPLGLSVAVLAIFVAIERRSRAPLVPLAFLRRGSILAANVLALILSASAGGLVFIITMYLQNVLKYDALSAGLAFLPGAAMFFFVGGWGSSRLVNRIGLKPVLVISAASATLGSALLVPISVGAGYLGVLPGLLVWSFGASVGFPALAMAGLAGTKHGEEGLASGLIQTSQRLGFPLGLAVLLTVASATDPGLGVLGFQFAFLGSALFCALGLGIALLMRTSRPPADIVEPFTSGPDPIDMK